ncbi:[protein-PII] uridylyltransferase [Phaeovibrio sulfidiphilus]|uniref:Bifunctional uridylyltransferase/uridylyl-removing enzyme n=1 Tax=Phaeovibrio sulfidiphilus TaxID=1220600 RepID=A0A8J6YWW4_9PROT|nr:[protein-PII] uridylyltransferase [Phaeovibrio sulfidiphilus]MBE1236173.1 [protein-PII] uridylyltransferase [Phaeovibrio sulfidiphilus]
MATQPVVNPDAIIRPEALMAELTRRVDGHPGARQRGTALVPVLRPAFEAGQAEIRRRFLEEHATGAATFADNTFLTDAILRLVLDYATTWAYPRASRTAGEQMSVLAVGGYGRGEMSPFSDVDLLFLMPYRATPLHEQMVEFVLYSLWDLKLKVGHAARSVDECIRLAGQDTTIMTALLESRLVWGQKEPARELQRRYIAEIRNGREADFIDAKLLERDQRHRRTGDTRYVLEPNIKDGKGGLRDLHTLFWIARFIYGVSDMDDLARKGVLSASAGRKFLRARDFLWTVRCHLHYLAGRPEERLTFDLQPEIARRMGYADRPGARGVERFMRHYFLTARTVGDLTRIFCALLEEQQKRRPLLSLTRLLGRPKLLDGFRVVSGRLAVSGPDAFRKDPMALMRIFRVAQEQRLDIHPETLRLMTESFSLVKGLRDNPKANALFLSILTSHRDPEVTLRQMSEAGILGRFLPDFARVTAQMQFDMYHVYTTDEHTLRALGLLHRVEAGELTDMLPLASREFHNIQSRRALFVAVLLHDIAKGRKGNHSVNGAALALEICPRLGLSDEETETVAWLVRHHLLMSSTAFNRDLGNPETVQEFCREVQSMERLRLLLVLTAVDIPAVGPNVWNNWKASLLRELFLAAEDGLTGGTARPRDACITERRAVLAQALSDWDEHERNAYMASHYPPYWLTFDSLAHMRHARLIQAARESGRPLTVDVHADPHRSVSEVIVYSPDRPRLFSRVAGALALAGVNILEARITTMVDGMALDVFTVQNAAGEALENPALIKRLQRLVASVLYGETDPVAALPDVPGRLPERAALMTVPPRVLVNNHASRTHTLIEVNGRDRPGFLYIVTSTLADLGVNVFSARINTYGERVVDVFYVKDSFGMKVEHPGKIARIREALLEAIGGKDPKAGASDETAAGTHEGTEAAAGANDGMDGPTEARM